MVATRAPGRNVEIFIMGILMNEEKFSRLLQLIMQYIAEFGFWIKRLPLNILSRICHYEPILYSLCQKSEYINIYKYIS